MGACMAASGCGIRSGKGEAERSSVTLLRLGCGRVAMAVWEKLNGQNFMFRNYWWIASAVATVAIALVVKLRIPNRESLIASALGTALVFCYFVQKQKLDELRLFNDLFSAFNKRYDEMNAKLEEIHNGKEISEAELKKTLVDYFNLCAEEYLFFDEGYIHPKVWQSWCSGMLYYLQNERIKQVWKQEVKLGSYYGLTYDVIEKFAGPALGT
jgi:hypothetical protein